MGKIEDNILTDEIIDSLVPIANQLPPEIPLRQVFLLNDAPVQTDLLEAYPQLRLWQQAFDQLGIKERIVINGVVHNFLRRHRMQPPINYISDLRRPEVQQAIESDPHITPLRRRLIDALGQKEENS